MTRTAAEAIAWAKNDSLTGTPRWHNMCLAFVHTCLDIPAKYPSAANAWENATNKHKVSSGKDCPRGVPVMWTGGSSGYGHIVLSVGGGLCWSTDIRRYGRPDLVVIDDITRSWGQNFQGWTEDLNGVTCWQTEDQWSSGTVYVDKLHAGSMDSDSVRRLQYRLMHTEGLKAAEVSITGNYGHGTRKAVQYWQRNISKIQAGPQDGSHLNNIQANGLFGQRYRVISTK